MQNMKLFVSEGNPHCLKVLAVLEVTGVKCDVQHVNHEGMFSAQTKASQREANVNVRQLVSGVNYQGG